jgi:hypothetical protein
MRLNVISEPANVVIALPRYVIGNWTVCMTRKTNGNRLCIHHNDHTQVLEVDEDIAVHDAEIAYRFTTEKIEHAHRHFPSALPGVINSLGFKLADLHVHVTCDVDDHLSVHIQNTLGDLVSASLESCAPEICNGIALQLINA